DCEGTPTAGTAEDDEVSVCAGNAFTISISRAADPANGLERIWQSSPAGEADWTDIEDAHATPYVVEEGIDEPTDFRYKATCNDGEPDYSNTIEVSLNPGTECYCVPTYTTGCTSNDAISNVSLTGESASFDNDSDCSDDA